MLSLDLSTLKEAAMAVALGLMMGLERERSGFERRQEGADRPFHRRAGDPAEETHCSLGARTFSRTLSQTVEWTFGGLLE